MVTIRVAGGVPVVALADAASVEIAVCAQADPAVHITVMSNAASVSLFSEPPAVGRVLCKRFINRLPGRTALVNCRSNEV